MKRFGIAVTAALALLMVLSGSVFAAAPGKHGTTHAVSNVDASAISGQPALDKDTDFGYYLWYDGSQFQLRTTDRGNGPGPGKYTGTITAHGEKGTTAAITNVVPLKLEQKDSAVAAGDKLKIHFETFNATDGVSFTAQNAKSVTFKLYRDGKLVGADHIYLGAAETNAPGNPFRVIVGK